MTNANTERTFLNEDNYHDVIMVVGSGQPVGFTLLVDLGRDTTKGASYTFSEIKNGSLVFIDDAGDKNGVKHGITKEKIPHMELAPSKQMITEAAAKAKAEKGIRLKALQSSFALNSPFQVGDLVQWKEGMRIGAKPVNGEPAVVIEVLDEPRRFGSDREHPGTAEQYDVVLGVLADKGEFVTHHYDSRRFEQYNGE